MKLPANQRRGRQGSLEALVRELAADGRAWVATGTLVEEPEAHEAWGYLLTLREQPSGRTVQARIAWASIGDRQGQTGSLAVGDEVVLLYPGGDANRAVALGVLPGGSRKLPSTADLAHIDLVDAGGMTVRRTEDGAVQPVMQATSFQADLNDLLAALQQFMATTSTATFGWQVAAAAVTFLADPRFTSFVTQAASGAYSAAALESE